MWERAFAETFIWSLCRRRAGQEIVRGLTGREAKMVVDLVFLLDKSEWDRFAGDRIEKIKYAEYVVCDSFHALAFSILFEKKFWSIDDSCRGNRNRNLLELASAEQYCVCDTADFVWENEKWDFTGMKIKIEEWIAESRKFLVDSIEDGE